MSDISTFATWAHDTHISNLFSTRDLFSVSSSASLYKVLEELETHHVHSLPVVNDETKLCEGMVDVLDIVCEIYDIANFSRFNKDGHFDAGDIASAFIDTSNLKHRLNSLVASMIIQKAAPDDAEVIATLPAYFEGPNIPSEHVTENDNLTTVLSKLGFDARHRVPVVSTLEEETSSKLSRKTSFKCSSVGIKMVGLICQSDLLKFFAVNLDKLPLATLEMKLSEFPKKTLCKVGRHSAMAEVLWHFKNRKMLSLIIEEHDGGFIAPLTADDFISCAYDLSIYSLAVDEFLLFKEKQATDRGKANPDVSAITCSSISLRDAINMMAEKHYSRLWLSNPGMKSPITHKPVVHGVVTIRDILMSIWSVIPGNRDRMPCED
eukprot:Tbor_TRINITY_DN5256_c3_g1::TRINITY_DN5256_c3_g1_i1::g.16058::m.16058